MGDVEAIHSGALDVNRGALKARFIEDTREIHVVYNISRDPWYFKNSIDRERNFSFPEKAVVGAGAHGGEEGREMGVYSTRVTSVSDLRLRLRPFSFDR